MKIVAVLILVFTTHVSYAATDVYQFESFENEKQFHYLISQFRCLVCQNQTLSESNAPLAIDLRTQIFSKISAGNSNDEIVAYLTSRYGDFILYKPPVNSQTILLWGAPLLFLVIGLAVMIKTLTRKSS